MSEPATVNRKATAGQKVAMLPRTFCPRFWESSDARISAVKIIKKRYERLKQDAGGDESYQRDLLIQRAAFMSILIETQEVEASEGQSFDLGVYTQATNTLMGLLKTLGLEKRIKSVADLKSYLAGKEQAA
jgi:hypothetical protein